MENPDFEIAMKFTDKDGRDINYGESAMDIAPDDDLMKGDFKPVSSYDDYSNFFELQSFDFGVSLEPMDKGAGVLSQAGARGAGPSRFGPTLHRAGAGDLHTGTAGAKAAGGEEEQDAFTRWRSASEGEAKTMRFQLKADAFSFTRVIDGVSPGFIEACAKKKIFKTAILAKRVSVGQSGNRTRAALAFLRIDFGEVQLKSVKWNDGELVTETVEFICQSLTLKYRQQKANGDLMAVSGPSIWNRERDAARQRRGGR